MKQFIIILLALFVITGLNGCKKTENSLEGSVSGTLTTGPNGDGDLPEGIVLSSKVSGTVSGSTVASSSSSSPSMSRSISQSYTGTDCDNSAYSVYLVGGDGTVIDSGYAYNGEFWVAADPNHEIVIEFACGQTCFGKPGSSDLVCDPISTTVVYALEKSLDSSVKSDPDFEGLSIAKIAEGIVETLKLMSQLDPTNNIVGKLEDAVEIGGDTGKETMKDIIMGSSVGALFTSMQTLAQEKKVHNQALDDGDATDDAANQAAQSAWTVRKVVEMLTGLGLQVEFELNSSDGMSIYHSIFTDIDTWVGTNFVAEFRKYVSQLYTSLYINHTTSTVTLVCVAENESDWEKKPIIYPPYLVSSGSEYNTLSCMHQDTLSDTDILGITKNGGTEMADINGDDIYRLKAYIKPSFEETNRNDPKGEHEKENDAFHKFSIDVIRIFDEFETAMSPGGVCADDVSGDVVNGGDFEFLEGFAQCIDDNGLDRYFSGLLGIYQFMRNNTLRSTKFSLRDIHDTLVGVNYMSMRLQGDLWQAGLDDRWLEVQLSDVSSDDNDTWISAWQFDSTSYDATADPVLDLVCPSIFCNNGDEPKSGPITMTLAQLYNSDAAINSVLEMNEPPYDVTMKTFENIPSMTEIRDYIFEDAHHEPYNTAGSKTFHVKGVSAADSSNDYEADYPILCMIQNANAAGAFVAGTSSIVCGAAINTTWDSEGNPADKSEYQSYYALQQRGEAGSVGEADMYYGLISINTGLDYNLNGREFRVRGVHEDYSGGLTADGQTLSSVNQEFCNTWQNSEGEMQSHCWQEIFDYVTVEFPDTFFPESSYYPYSWNIPMTSTWEDYQGNTYEWDWNMSLAISRNNTENIWNDDFAICLANNAVIVDTTNDITKVLYAEVDSSSDLVDCFNNSESTFYYLQLDWRGVDASSDYEYQLVRNDGSFMWSLDSTTDSTTDAMISLEEIAAVNPANDMGPAVKEERLLHFEIANLSHDAKYDPFCDDTNGNGYCDCTSSLYATDYKCNLTDDVIEPTLSDAPYWYGDSQVDDVRLVISTCGGESGMTLIDCLQDLQDGSHPTADGSADISQLHNVDWSRLFECSDSTKVIKWIDTYQIINGQTTDVGGNCGSLGEKGPVRMIKLTKRNNAYDVERPHTMLKLISAATATSGTGVTIDPNADTFNFQEAIALTFLRFAFPLNVTVQKDGETVERLPVYMSRVRVPGKQSDPSSGLLRAFLEKGGFIPAAE